MALPGVVLLSGLARYSGTLQADCVSNANLIFKVYFPRLVVPTSAVMVSFVDFLISGTILLGLGLQR